MNHMEIAKSITHGVTELVRRLETAESEALQAGGVSNSWAIEVGRLHRLLDQSSHYVADNAVRPQAVQFNNGQAVRILTDENGPYLNVSTLPLLSTTQSLPTPIEQAALECLKESNFLERLVTDRFDENQ